jgi:hypothetical protein
LSSTKKGPASGGAFFFALWLKFLLTPTLLGCDSTFWRMLYTRLHHTKPYTRKRIRAVFRL